jgi:hypothetical protein
MPQERIEALRLSKPIQGPVNDLVRALNAASTKEDIEREGEMQIAFIMATFARLGHRSSLHHF